MWEKWKIYRKDVNFKIKNGEFKFYRKRVNSTEKVQNWIPEKVFILQKKAWISQKGVQIKKWSVLDPQYTSEHIIIIVRYRLLRMKNK